MAGWPDGRVAGVAASISLASEKLPRVADDVLFPSNCGGRTQVRRDAGAAG
jgi:hypothetical protein